MAATAVSNSSSSLTQNAAESQTTNGHALHLARDSDSSASAAERLVVDNGAKHAAPVAEYTPINPLVGVIIGRPVLSTEELQGLTGLPGTVENMKATWANGEGPSPLDRQYDHPLELPQIDWEAVRRMKIDEGVDEKPVEDNK